MARGIEMKTMKIWWHGTKIKILEVDKLDPDFINWLLKISESERKKMEEEEKRNES